MRKLSVISDLSRGAFTLVEVTLALGILAFCLCSVLGLLPVGLDSVRNAARQAEAGMLLRQMAASLQTPVKLEGDRYQLPDPGTLGTLEWTVGGGSFSRAGFVTSGGVSAGSAATGDLVWRLEITPPEETWERGQALIRIAWPATAQWQGGKWENAQGSLRMLVFFRP